MKANRWLETGEIAADLGVHPKTVAKKLDSGDIPLKVHRLGKRGHRRVREDEYREWLESEESSDREAA